MMFYAATLLVMLLRLACRSTKPRPVIFDKPSVAVHTASPTLPRSRSARVSKASIGASLTPSDAVAETSVDAKPTIVDAKPPDDDDDGDDRDDVCHPVCLGSSLSQTDDAVGAAEGSVAGAPGGANSESSEEGCSSTGNLEANMEAALQNICERFQHDLGANMAAGFPKY